MLLASLAFAVVTQTPDFTRSWQSVRSGIESRYYGRLANASRMNALLDKYEPRAKKATSEAEFSSAVNGMIEEFGDSHFGLFTRADQGYYMMDSLARPNAAKPMPHIGAWFKQGPDGCTVQMLIDGGPAEEAGLRKGDVIFAINGKPFSPVESLRTVKGEKAKIDYRRAGKAATAEVQVAEDNGTEFFLDGTRRSIRVIESGGTKYGYIHLWTMSNEQQKSTLAGAVYGKLKDTDGFILDIRDGFGGRPEGFGDPFFRPEAKLEWIQPGVTLTQLFGYARPLVVIINKGSRSAKEVFAQIMKTSGRATLVGEATGGNVLGTFPAPLGDWGYLEIPAVDVKVDGLRIERNGVTPNVAVAKEFDESGKDLYLEAAISTLQKRAIKSNSRE